MAAKDLPLDKNEYVGYTYGNILDRYASPTYNIRLYMIKDESQVTSSEPSVSSESGNQDGNNADRPPAAEQTATTPAEGTAPTDSTPTNSGTAASPVATESTAPAETPAAGANSGQTSGSPGTQFVAPPAQTVILAQTGVTGTVIDDVKIENIVQTTRNSTKITFTIKQPGAASFLDQIQLAKAYLGIKPSAIHTVYLEIVFKGYTASNDDEDDGGEIATIAGPYRWKLQLTKIAVSINSSGSEYQCEAIPQAQYAYRDPIFKLPMNFQTKGKSITEHITDLEKKLNEWHSEVASYDVKDVIKFDLSELIGTGAGGTTGRTTITDDSLLTSKDADAEDLNRITNELWDAGSAIDRQQALEDAPKYEGTEAEKIFEEDLLTHKEGTSIDRVFGALLSMCPEFYSKVSRKEDPLDPDSPAKTDQASVAWFKVKAATRQLGFDKVRKDYAYEYTFSPVLYETPKDNVAVDAKELDLSKDDADARLSQIKAAGMLMKSYQYLFTGLNDQILDLDIKYDNGIALLLPAAGGTIGDYSIAASDIMSSQAPADKDLSLEGTVRGFFDAVNTLTNKNKLTGFLGGLADRVDSLSDGFVANLSDAVGVTPADLKTALTDASGARVDELANALDSATLKKVAAQAKFDSEGTPVLTEDAGTLTDSNTGGDYSPSFSGYAYSADIINPADMSDPVMASELISKGYLTLEDFGEAVKTEQAASTSQDVKNVADTATYKSGSPRNKLFGYLANQQATDQFMLQCKARLRGDPWYLGGGISETTGKPASTETQASFEQSENCFWLEIRSPIAYDPDWEDEDSTLNSGYWKYEGISHSYSGLYRLIKAVNEFSGGIYTVGVEAQKLGPGTNNITPAADNADGSLPSSDTSQYTGRNGNLAPDELVPVTGGGRLNPQAAAAYERMVAAARADGINWTITDSYRSYEAQVDVARRKGLYSEGGLAAKPGTSNHGYGSAVDLGGGANKRGTPQNNWLVQNAGRFGFKNIPREAWHWEYKG